MIAALILIPVASFVLLVAELLRAPVGHEDENGFTNDEL